MNNIDFWDSIHSIINDGFTPDGLEKLERYAEKFITNELRFKRFLPQEQYGCTKGGSTHVIATILSGAEIGSDCCSEALSDFKKMCKRAEAQALIIEKWSKKVGLWFENVDQAMSDFLGENIAEGGEAKVYDNGVTLIKTIGLDYYILPNIALDRVTLHNAYFPETALEVIGFGRDCDGAFKILVEQPYIKGRRMEDEQIELFAIKMGFDLKNRRNWTYATPEIYLSDLHDENVLCSDSGTVYIIDCDIRLNTPELRCGGVRIDTNEISTVEIV